MANSKQNITKIVNKAVNKAIESLKKNKIEMTEDDFQKFINCFIQHIINRLETSETKITDLVLEELISYSLKDSGCIHEYKSGSHTPGRDIESFNNDASVKSGKITRYKSQGKNAKISISSYRLGTFKDSLDEMKKYIDVDGKNFHHYFILGRDEKSDDEYIIYNFYILPADIFLAENMNWYETDKKWETKENSPIKLEIKKSMSYQLWITIDLDHIEKYRKFEIRYKKSKLGEKRFIANPYLNFKPIITCD